MKYRDKKKDFFIKPFFYSHGFLRRGFTIVEMLVVLGIMTILSGSLIAYNATSRRQISLYVEQARLVQIIAKAKSLAIATYLSPGTGSGSLTLCGYGVRADYTGDSYEVFSYEAEDCDSVASIDNTNESPGQTVYTTIESYNLANGLVFGSGPDRAEYLFFIPPYPKMLAWWEDDLSAQRSGSVYVETSDEAASIKVTVNPAGQISF